MIIIGIIAIVFGFIFSAKAFIDSNYNERVTFTAYAGGLAMAMGIWCIASDKSPKAIDVYKGKTTLQITYKGNTPIDTTVVYK